jgi:diguanylate cyclase (GGDEF)-like protein
MLDWLQAYMTTDSVRQMVLRCLLFLFASAIFVTILADQTFIRFQVPELQAARHDSAVYTFFVTILLGAPWTFAFALMARKLAHSNARLETMARRDSLTGLCNRGAFLADVETAKRKARRHGARGWIILLDVDHFKRINDTHGHEAGDNALRHVASVLGSTVTPDMQVGRLGGEEFAVAFFGAADGLAFAERLRCGIEHSRWLHNGVPVQITVSLGVSEILAHEDLPSAIRRADTGLYAAKRSGRNRVQVEAPSVEPSGADFTLQPSSNRAMKAGAKS